MVRKIQSYMWPAIKKGASVVAISSSGNGKTWGHAVSITSALTQRSSVNINNYYNHTLPLVNFLYYLFSVFITDPKRKQSISIGFVLHHKRSFSDLQIVRWVSVKF